MKTEYSVEIGSGKKKEVIVFEAPDGLSDAQLSDLATTALRHAKPGQKFSHPVYDSAQQTHIDTRPKPPAPKPDTSLGHNAAVAAHGALTGGQDTLNALSDVPGVGTAAKFASAIYGKVLGGQWGQPQTSGQNYLHAGARGGAAAATMGGAGGIPVAISGVTGGVSGEAARQGGYGKGVQAAATLVGGLGGGLASARVPGLRAPVAPNALASDGQRVYQAAKRLGGEKHLLPADVGGTATKMATGFSRMTLGGIPLADKTGKNLTHWAGVRNETAAGVGQVADTTGAGQALQRGARNWIDSSEKRASQLYDAIPIHGERPSILANTRSALASLTAGLKSNPRLSSLIEDPRLKAFEEAFAGKTKEVPTGILDASGKPVMRAVKEGGALSWEDLKAFRTYVGEKAGAPSLQSDTSQKALKSLYGALSEDMRATAAAEGPQALKSFERANQFWRGRQGRIDDVVSTVLGKGMDKGPMQAFENATRLANAKGGDPVKLGRLLRSMSPDEADTARATVIQRLGLAKEGVQDAHGDAFSASEFVTQWNKMDPRSKAVLFNKPGLRPALDDLAEVLGGMKGADKYANTSKTGLITNGVVLVAKFFGNPVAGGAAALGELALGKALSSPVMTKALANLGRARTPVATKAALVSIANIGARNPDLAGVARHIAHVANDNMPGLHAAATPSGKQDQHQSETDEILKSVAEDGRRQQEAWQEEDRQSQQQELPDLQPDAPE